MRCETPGVHEPHLDPGNDGEALVLEADVVLGVDGHLVQLGWLVPLHGLPGGRDGRDAEVLLEVGGVGSPRTQKLVQQTARISLSLN